MSEWTLLLLGENHGIVGPPGDEFFGQPKSYRRVRVVEASTIDSRDAEIERLKRELRERNQFLRDANRGAELNAKVNRLLVDEAAELRAEKEQLRELLSRAAPWVQTCGNLVLVEEIRKALRRESNDE